MMTTKIKWLIGILVVSLGVNIFVAGIMLGKGAKSRPVMRGGDPGIEFNIRRFSRHLGDEDRAKVREILRSERSALGNRYRDIKAGERRIRDLLSEPTVNKAALAEALDKHGEMVENMHKPMRRVMIEVIADLDMETRQKMAKDMFKRGKRRGSKGDGPHGDGRRFGGPDGSRFKDRPPPPDIEPEGENPTE